MYQEDLNFNYYKCKCCDLSIIERDLITYNNKLYHTDCFEKLMKKTRFEIKIFGFAISI